MGSMSIQRLSQEGSLSPDVSEQCLSLDGLAPDASGRCLFPDISGGCLCLDDVHRRTCPGDVLSLGGIYSMTSRKWISAITLIPSSLLFFAESF